jgi:hypothetical protein
LQKAKYAVLLTGTPALSRPIELFKQVNYEPSELFSVSFFTLAVHQGLSRVHYARFFEQIVYGGLKLNFFGLQLEALQPTAYKSVHEYGNR